ncbi:DUF6030 family protein [Roseibium polysiphoniae]|uniref:Uncharacterized protein n=1 Tax=Roseibium polysiphoniae TaxID=2571221 RepID=A0ABR9C520_9HYPH|nr:DUF6030 family protein [Roseibium polysiphoniae]MBD8874959.1 hypothetical protein [Roseibium polysiphoniae]
MRAGRRKKPAAPAQRPRRTGITWGDEVPAGERRKAPPAAGPVSGDGLPRQTDWTRVLLMALPLMLLAFAAIVVLSNLQLVEPPDLEVAAPPPDPLAGFSADAQDSLTAPDIQVPARLKLTFLGKPEELCAELTEIGLPNGGWTKAPFRRGRWQCASDVVPLTTPSVDFGSATLFFLLRGGSEDRVDYLRLKLNVEDPRQMEYGEATVRSVIGALSDRYSWAVPDRFLQAISDFEALEMTDRGVRLSVAPEDPNLTGDPAASQRLNIILNFGEPDLIRPADGFQR